jgi:hypothetical protein
VFRDWRPIQGLGPGGGLWWPEVRAGRLKDALASENDRIAIYQYINPTEASRGLLHCLFWQNEPNFNYSAHLLISPSVS